MLKQKLHLILDEYFKSKNLSSYKIAKDTKLSQPTIGRYRDGNSSPTEKNWNKLIEVYKDLQPYVDEKLSEMMQENLNEKYSSPKSQNRIPTNFTNRKINGLEDFTPLEILNYIHHNLDSFKEEPLYKTIEKDAVSVYKSEKEGKEIEQLVVRALKEHLGKNK